MRHECACVCDRICSCVPVDVAIAKYYAVICFVLYFFLLFNMFIIFYYLTFILFNIICKLLHKLLIFPSQNMCLLHLIILQFYHLQIIGTFSRVKVDVKLNELTGHIPFFHQRGCTKGQ